MKIIRLLLGLLMCLSISSINASPYEKLILKDGSILEGYMSIQHPGINFVFVAEKSVVYLSSSKVSSIVETNENLKDLPAAWGAWAEEHPEAVKKRNDVLYLSLSDILFVEQKAILDTVVTETDIAQVDSVGSLFSSHNQNAKPRKVRILEHGSVIKYLDYSVNSYQLTWNDIRGIERYPRLANELTGLVDVVEMRSGAVYEGQIISQIIGKQIRLLKDDEIIQVIDVKDIVIQKKKKLNANQTLLEQAQMIDIVCSRNHPEVKGVIVAQHYGTEKEAGYLLVQMESGDIQRIENDMVTEIRRAKNADFTPLTDVKIEGDEILICRKQTEEAKIEKKNDLMLIAPDSKAVILKADSIVDKLTVEFKDNPENRGIILLKLVQMKVSKETRSGYTYEDLVTNGVLPIATSVSVNKTLKRTYPVSKGDYILYRPKDRKSILCKIE